MPRGSSNKKTNASNKSTTSKRRKRKQVDVDHISPAWYVGYAEDEESVEAIMKKFEELEQLQKEVIAQKKEITGSSSQMETSECTSDPASKGETSVNAIETEQDTPELTQQHLEELFRRTSAFTVKSVALDVNVDEMNDLEWWNFEHGRALDEEWEEENDYQILDDEGWERMLQGPEAKSTSNKEKSTKKETKEKIPKVKEPKPAKEKKPPKEKEVKIPKPKGNDREALLAKYKVLQVQMQDRNGNYFLMKKRVTIPDPDIPTYVRIPNMPIPRSWVKKILPHTPNPNSIDGARVISTDILTFPLHTLGNNFQAIYLDAPFLLPGEPPYPGKITVEQFGEMDIPSVMQCGFLFIWTEKELTPRVIQATDKWGFRYVENFAWIKKDLNNRIARQPSRYFNKSKTTCLIFRKEGDTELRHQRNPDCEFDFIKPKRPGQLTEEKPQFIYEVIETLLPTACYDNPFRNGEGLLELWGKKPHGRKGWTTLIQSHASP